MYSGELQTLMRSLGTGEVRLVSRCPRTPLRVFRCGLAALFCVGLSSPAWGGAWEEARVELQLGNKPQAAKLFRRAARDGDLRGRYSLGLMLLQGDGIPRDDEEGAEWIRKAAKRGLVPAQSLLGTLHVSGQGVERDLGEAVRWYRLAAEAGDRNAQVGLGALLAEGLGSAPDDVEAHLWLSLAADQGHEIAIQRLARLTVRMSPAALEEAKNLKKEWKPRRRHRPDPAQTRVRSGGY